ncbi:phosphoribosyltransferase [[Flexibacter] sp. ATCC 35208]|uniref:phosphoribosyltransferase n=1 Tax=[Flexibacter] sp. ATCC 35208 TaxID=1936242 RepID=UPI0009CF504F|nr:phosphoribosyltransferase [[Flexibacter] sp. ATCC 35208]OMP80114.1 hypothetical protein BW716_06370 [[Flexibacter] sp. ATCC 35208]
MQLNTIDELVIKDHRHLESGIDSCYYFMEYTAQAGFSHSKANDIIQNLKKPVSRKGKDEYRWKIWAMEKIAGIFATSLQVPPGVWTLVPMPPSKTRQHPDYDDRMWQVLQKFQQLQACDVRDILSCVNDRDAAHISGARRDIAALQANLRIDVTGSQNLAPNVALVDDVLSTGAQFKAAKNLLLQQHPHLNVIGIFVARRSLVEGAKLSFGNL